MINFKMTKLLKINRGLTLVETLVATSIFVIIILVINYSLVSFYKYNAFALEQVSAIDSARRGINPAINNIREMTYSDEGAYPIVSAATSSLSFYSDVDTDSNIEKIRLFLDSGVFKKGVIKSAGDPPTYDSQPENIFILSDNVRNIEESVNIFTYYDNTGAQVTDLSNISNITFVIMNIVVNVNPARAPNNFTLRTSAALRNLKSNL